MNQADKILKLWEKFLNTEPKEKVQKLIDKINSMDSIGPTVDEYIESIK